MTSSPRLSAATLAAMLLLLAAPLLAVPRIEARGLMRDRAVLVIDGATRVLRRGETSPEGVTLLSSDSRGARVRYGDEELELGLSGTVGGRFAEPEVESVRVPQDRVGHYRVRGTIEGQPVRFLVDTGATVLALSSRRADALGIDWRGRGRSGSVVTAGGEAVSHFVRLASVSVGGIERRGVEAAVVEGDHPTDVLLGMSFLRHLDLEERRGVLTLSPKR